MATATADLARKSPAPTDFFNRLQALILASYLGVYIYMVIATAALARKRKSPTKTALFERLGI